MFLLPQNSCLGFLVIHAPSGCTKFYEKYSERRWVTELPNATIPDPPEKFVEPPMPITWNNTKIGTQSGSLGYRVGLNF